jgi:hypothetical protein
VPEDQSNPVERHAVAQHLGRCRVPQDVGAFGRRTTPARFMARFTTEDAVAVCE